MNIEHLVNDLVRKHATRNPFKIITGMNAILVLTPLVDVRGFYQYYKRNNIIYINENLTEHDQKFVCAHELGHMLMHKKSNFIYMDTKTAFNTTKYEIEANKFAVELLISDNDLVEFSDCSIEKLARIFGYHEKLIELRLK